MEILIGIIILVVAVGAYFYYKNKLDTNKDGHVRKEEVAPVVEEVKEKVAEAVKQAADVNKDGKVDISDAVEVVKKARTKKPASNTDKPAAKKQAAKTPAAKKPASPKKPKMTVAK